MTSKNIDIIAISLLLLGAALYTSVKHAAVSAHFPFEHMYFGSEWEAPRVVVPLPPAPPVPPLPSISFR
jgi:hypothetical protein